MKDETKFKLFLIAISILFGLYIGSMFVIPNTSRYAIVSHAGRIVRVEVQSGKFWVMTDKGWQPYSNSAAQ